MPALSFTLEAFSGARSFVRRATEVRLTDSALLGTSWPRIFHRSLSPSRLVSPPSPPPARIHTLSSQSAPYPCHGHLGHSPRSTASYGYGSASHCFPTLHPLLPSHSRVVGRWQGLPLSAPLPDLRQRSGMTIPPWHCLWPGGPKPRTSAHLEAPSH